MKHIFKNILIEIDKLPVLDKKCFLQIYTYQLEVLSKIYKKKEIMTTELLKSQTSYSKAQKYRYLKQLVSLGLCKKKHNLYFS
jgi:predicted transcriptional regulator